MDFYLLGEDEVYTGILSLADDQLSCIEENCAKIRYGLERADFAAKRRIIALLDLGGKIAFEKWIVGELCYVYQVYLVKSIIVNLSTGGWLPNGDRGG